MPVGIHLLNKALYHKFRGIEVRNHAIPHRSHSADIGAGTLVHQFGLVTQGHNLAGYIVESNNARLIENYLVILKNDRIGRSEVNCEFLCQEG